MSASRPAPLAEFLSPDERLARIDVRAQARQCTAVLCAALDPSAVPLGEVNGAFNKGSLMYAAVGDLVEAERSCLRQIGVLTAALHRPESRSDAVAMLLRPWVNIGRLRMLSGRWREALPYFQAVRALLDLDTLVVDGTEVGPDDLVALSRRPGFHALQRWARLVLVRDVAKAYCRGGAFADLAAAVAGWVADPALATWSWTLEARAIAYAHGYGDGVWSLAAYNGEIRRRGGRDLIDVALAVHGGYLAMAQGRPSDADDAVIAGTRLVRAHDGAHGLDLTNVRLLLRLGELGEAWGSTDRGEWCFRRLLALGLEAGDEQLTVEAATALARACPHDAERMRATIDAVLDTTLHFVLRRQRPGAAPLSTDEVCELAELRAAELAVLDRYATAPVPA